MRREGRLTGNLYSRRLREMVKVQGKPTNASKSSGRCRRSRCQLCHLVPVCKSKAKTKGRNKRSLLLDDEWVMYTRSCSSRVMNTLCANVDYDEYAAFLANVDYEEYMVPDVWHADIKDVCNYNDDALSILKAGYDDDYVAMSMDADMDPHEVLLKTLIVDAGDVILDETGDASIWDHRMFDDMVNAVVFDNNDDKYEYDEDFTGFVGEMEFDIESEKSSILDDMVKVAVFDNNDDKYEYDEDFPGFVGEMESDIESEKSSILDDWCHVTPIEITDDWYLC